MDWNLLVTGSGIALTAFLAYISPFNRARQRRKAVEARLFGSAPVTDRKGNPLAPGVDTIFTQLDALTVLLTNASLLNGQGDQLLRDVAETKTLLSRHILSSDTTHAALWAAAVDTLTTPKRPAKRAATRRKPTS